MTKTMTPEQQAVADELRANYTKAKADAEAKLSVSILVGQGYVCVTTDNIMAIEHRGEGYGLTVIDGNLSRVVHWTQRDAESIAKHWNSNPATDEHPRLKVRAIHYREALKLLIAHCDEMMAWMENGFQEKLAG